MNTGPIDLEIENALRLSHDFATGNLPAKPEPVRHSNQTPNRRARRAMGSVNRKRLKEVNRTKAQTAELWSKVLAFFGGDETKTKAWFGTANPMLGGAVPAAMIFQGRLAKLARFVDTSLAENEAPHETV